jgi:AraC-like DNA-binding protein
MTAAPAPGSGTAFALDVGHVAMHANAVTCVLSGRRAPVSVSDGGGSITADIVLVRADAAHEVRAQDGGFCALYLGGLAWPGGGEVAVALEGPLAYRAADAICGRDDAEHELRSALGQGVEPLAPAIASIRRRLAEDPMHRMTQLELGRRLGVERTTALRMFKAATGQTFRSYKRWTGLLHAIDRIIAGSPIGAAALDSGFADAAHFSRAFRDSFGLSPTRALNALVRPAEP